MPMPRYISFVAAALTFAIVSNSLTAQPSPADKSPVAPNQAKEPKGRTLDELLLFFPMKFPEGNWKPNDLEFEDVWFKSDDGTRIHGWYCPCKKPRAILLYAHGNAGNLTYDRELMRLLQQRLRVATLSFDYRGYGRSEGVPTVEGVLKDARAARSFLAERSRVRASKIVLMGRSLGGAIATRLAAETPARGLVLESTFSSLKDVASHHYPRLAWLVPADKLDSVSHLAKHQGPLLQSHGDGDQVVPFSLGKKLFEAAKGPREFMRIADADHNDPLPAEYYKRLDRFIEKLPPP